MLYKYPASANTDRILNWKTSAHNKQQGIPQDGKKIATWEKDWFMVFEHQYKSYRILVNEMSNIYRYMLNKTRYLPIRYNNYFELT